MNMMQTRMAIEMIARMTASERQAFIAEMDIGFFAVHFDDSAQFDVVLCLKDCGCVIHPVPSSTSPATHDHSHSCRGDIAARKNFP